MNILNTNTQKLPAFGSVHPGITLRAVLVEGRICDYAVYVGLCLGNETTDEEIAALGHKLNYREALLHFPGLLRKNYRR